MNRCAASRFLAGALIVVALVLTSVGGGGQAGAAPPRAPVALGSLRPLAQGAEGFLSVWARPDLPVAQGRVARSYIWGPTPLTTRLEPWTESPGGQRQVQYWDKARMEITYPNASPNDPFYVTNGRVVYEMVSGLIQVGNTQFEARAGSEEPVAGDNRTGNAEAPSYAAFRRTASILPGESQWVNRVGQNIITYIDYRGVVGRIDYLAGYGARYGYYVDETKHNMADVFWGFLNQQGIVYKNGAYVTEPLFNWVAVTGYPITEPYWITARVGGQPYAILVQLFERRVLTFAPLFPAEYRIQMGNVGQHYLTWRYAPTEAPAPPPAATPAPPPPVPPAP